MSSNEDEQLAIPARQTAPAAAPVQASTAALLSPPPADLPVVDDDGLARELRRIAQGTDDVLVIANVYTVCVLHRADANSPWQRVCCGELAEKSVAAAKPLARKRLWWGSTARAPWDADPVTVPMVKGTLAFVNGWLKKSVDEAGREGNVTDAIKEELTYLAGWRCQFAGCGRNLKLHGATGGRGRFSYFAHIVAASPGGPRGNEVLSKLLASELSNFMLMCDECHRLIDKVNPARYTVEVLREMREDNIAEVRRLLGNLQHKPAEVVAIIGNIAGQPPQFSIDDAQEALWGSKLRSSGAKPEHYFYPGGQHHDVHSPAYWLSLFQTLKTDLPRLQGLLNGTSQGGTPRPRLAIFPLHSTSVLLLAGRILGDAAGTHVFQPHRNKVGQGTRWGWPLAGTLPIPPLDRFKVEEVAPSVSGQDEAILVVALTSDIEATRMPATCAVDGKLLLPTLRITGPTFDKDCMQQPEDLQLVGLAVDAAVRKLQDEWRVRKVRLFVSAPASAVVAVGQKLQARHHADFICHEAAPGPGSAYRATIEITPTLVRELVSGLANSLSLQP